MTKGVTKKIAVVLLIILSVTAVCFVAAACGSEAEDVRYDYLSFKYSEQYGGLVVSVADARSLPAELTIPSLYYYDGDTVRTDKSAVVAIADNGFKNIAKLTSVSLPETVTKIGAEAFSGCTKLLSINTAKVSSIGSAAFSGCSALASVEFNAITEIPDNAFKNCSSLTAVSGSAEITKIGESAFQTCIALMEIKTDLSKLTYIGYRAFFFTGALTTFNVPSGCTVIEGAFEGWSQYQTVNYL